MSKGLCTEVKKATGKSWTMKIDGQIYWTHEDPSAFQGLCIEFDYKPSQWNGKTNNWVVKDSLKFDNSKVTPEQVCKEPKETVATGDQFKNELLNKTLNTCMMGAVELTKAALTKENMTQINVFCTNRFRELFKAAREV